MEGNETKQWWIHDLEPVLFQISEVLAVRWYGLAYVASFIAAYFLLRWYHRRGMSDLSPVQLESLFIYLVTGVIIGGRLGYMLLYDTEAFLRNPLIFIQFWDGGMASHGGFIGVTLAILLFSRRNKIDLLHVGDVVCVVAPLGLFLGRIANFINAELWGKPTQVAWAVIFPKAPFDPDAYFVYSTALERLVNPRHPSQLYAAVLEGLLLFSYMQWRFWSQRDPLRTHGKLAGEFVVGYSVVRIVTEVFREPDASLLLGMSRGTLYSLAVGLIGVALILYVIKKNQRLNSQA